MADANLKEQRPQELFFRFVLFSPFDTALPRDWTELSDLCLHILGEVKKGIEDVHGYNSKMMLILTVSLPFVWEQFQQQKKVLTGLLWAAISL